jgi:hypothetical protein
VVLADPDTAGRHLRDALERQLGPLLHAFVSVGDATAAVRVRCVTLPPAARCTAGGLLRGGGSPPRPRSPSRKEENTSSSTLTSHGVQRRPRVQQGGGIAPTQGCWEALWYRPGLCQCRFRMAIKGLYRTHNRQSFSGIQSRIYSVQSQFLLPSQAGSNCSPFALLLLV